MNFRQLFSIKNIQKNLLLVYLLIVIIVIIFHFVFVYMPMLIGPKIVIKDEKTTLYCQQMKIGYTHEEINNLLGQKGEYREQVITEFVDFNYLYVKIIYLDEEINDEYGDIYLLYENGLLSAVRIYIGREEYGDYCVLAGHVSFLSGEGKR